MADQENNKYNYISPILEYRISKVALRDDDILHIMIKENEVFNARDFMDLFEAAGKIGNGKRFRNLVSIGNHTLPDTEARQLSTSKEGSIYKIADAFVIRTLSQKLIANFYINFHKPVVPTRYFTNDEDAIRWLKEQKE